MDLCQYCLNQRNLTYYDPDTHEVATTSCPRCSRPLPIECKPNNKKFNNREYLQRVYSDCLKGVRHENQ